MNRRARINALEKVRETLIELRSTAVIFSEESMTYASFYHPLTTIQSEIATQVYLERSESEAAKIKRQRQKRAKRKSPVPKPKRR